MLISKVLIARSSFLSLFISNQNQKPISSVRTLVLPLASYFSTKANSPKKEFRRFPINRPKGNLKKMKIESEIFHQLFTPELNTLLNIFKKYDFEIRMAGGPVRDLLMGIKPADLDFATTATPDEMKEIFTKEEIRMINTKGEKHGTITARINEAENYEITTLRIDVVTDGRRAEVEFTKDWELDSGRRDLTINSMFLDKEGIVYDYFNGTEDVKNRLVRFVGNPVDRIQEDYLRILRYFRFYGRISEFADRHEEVTLTAIKSNVEGLEIISGERIWTEMKKTLSGNFSKELMLKMLELGIGPKIGIPEKVNIEEFSNLVDRLKELKLTVNPIVLIAALLYTPEECADFHKRIKLSAYERDLCNFIIVYRHEAVFSLKQYKDMTIFSKSKQTDFRQWVEELLKYKGQKGILAEFQAWIVPKFPVNGHMLMESKIPAGKSMTKVIQKLKEEWADSDFKLTAEELLIQLPAIREELKL